MTIISEMITPALFILGSGSLLAAAMGRLARIVDYFRKLSDGYASAQITPSEAHRKILRLVQKRANYAELTVAAICLAIMFFVMTCLLIVVDRAANHTIYWAPVSGAIIGALLLLIASALMLAESRMGVRQLKDEIDDVWAKIGEIASK